MPEERTVLVTGAGGFIGGRVVEACCLSGRFNPRAGIRRWASAARLGRFPVELVPCDLLNADEVAAAISGAWAVVHCAVGDRESTLAGTQMLLTAARRAAVSRFVHLSTVEVYGQAEGDIDESHPTLPGNDDYGRMKWDAEQLVWEASGAGLPVCVLRPSVVYGPFSKYNTVRLAQRLTSGQWGLFEGYGQGICNLLYVDDLVHAIFTALEHPAALGQAFNINGPDRVTWNEFTGAFNQALGLPPLHTIRTSKIHVRSTMLAPVRAAAHKVLSSHRQKVMKIYERYELAQRWIKRAESTLKTTPPLQELKLYNRRARYLADKASRLLGYTPKFDMNRGLQLSVAWLKLLGLVK